MKVTRHKDGTVSLRLRRYGAGNDEPSMDDIRHALSVAENGFEAMAFKFPAEAEDYRRLANHYRQLLADVVKGAGLR